MINSCQEVTSNSIYKNKRNLKWNCFGPRTGNQWGTGLIQESTCRGSPHLSGCSCSGTARDSYLLYFLLYLHFVCQCEFYRRRSGQASLHPDRYLKQKLAGQEDNKHGFTVRFHSGVRFRGDVKSSEVKRPVSARCFQNKSSTILLLETRKE